MCRKWGERLLHPRLLRGSRYPGAQRPATTGGVHSTGSCLTVDKKSRGKSWLDSLEKRVSGPCESSTRRPTSCAPRWRTCRAFGPDRRVALCRELTKLHTGSCAHHPGRSGGYCQEAPQGRIRAGGGGQPLQETPPPSRFWRRDGASPAAGGPGDPAERCRPGGITAHTGLSKAGPTPAGTRKRWRQSPPMSPRTFWALATPPRRWASKPPGGWPGNCGGTASDELCLRPDLITPPGPDSYISRVAAVMLGGTGNHSTPSPCTSALPESIRTRHGPSSLAADLTGFLASAFAVRLFFGA